MSIHMIFSCMNGRGHPKGDDERQRVLMYRADPQDGPISDRTFEITLDPGAQAYVFTFG